MDGASKHYVATLEARIERLEVVLVDLARIVHAHAASGAIAEIRNEIANRDRPRHCSIGEREAAIMRLAILKDQGETDGPIN